MGWKDLTALVLLILFCSLTLVGVGLYFKDCFIQRETKIEKDTISLNKLILESVRSLKKEIDGLGYEVVLMRNELNFLRSNKTSCGCKSAVVVDFNK